MESSIAKNIVTLTRRLLWLSPSKCMRESDGTAPYKHFINPEHKDQNDLNATGDRACVKRNRIISGYRENEEIDCVDQPVVQ